MPRKKEKGFNPMPGITEAPPTLLTDILQAGPNVTEQASQLKNSDDSKADTLSENSKATSSNSGFFTELVSDLRDKKITSIWKSIKRENIHAATNEKLPEPADPLFTNAKELVRRCYLEGNSWMRWRQHRAKVTEALESDNISELLQKLSEIPLITNNAGYIPRLITFLTTQLEYRAVGITGDNYTERLGSNLGVEVEVEAGAAPTQR